MEILLIASNIISLTAAAYWAYLWYEMKKDLEDANVLNSIYKIQLFGQDVVTHGSESKDPPK